MNSDCLTFRLLFKDDDIHEVAKETPGIWCVITCYERDQSRGEFQVDRSVIIVDGSSNAFDVTRYAIFNLFFSFINLFIHPSICSFTCLASFIGR